VRRLTRSPCDDGCKANDDVYARCISSTNALRFVVKRPTRARATRGISLGSHYYAHVCGKRPLALPAGACYYVPELNARYLRLSDTERNGVELSSQSWRSYAFERQWQQHKLRAEHVVSDVSSRNARR
jgi:hypothetical protein